MNTNNVVLNKAYKNHTAFCEALGVTPKTSGKSKQLQYKEFERFFVLEK